MDDMQRKFRLMVFGSQWSVFWFGSFLAAYLTKFSEADKKHLSGGFWKSNSDQKLVDREYVVQVKKRASDK